MQTGVSPIAVGRHTTLGTHNALLSLGQGCYLEILAKDPNQILPNNVGVDALKNLHFPQLIGWAVQCDDFAYAAQLTTSCGLTLSETQYGSRDNLDGSRVNYSFATIQGTSGLGFAVPFLVEWGDTQHPLSEYHLWGKY